MLYCWELISEGKDRKLALQYAIKGHAYLDKKRLLTQTAKALLKIYMGYNIVSVAYAWNNYFEEAKLTDSYYMPISPLYPNMEEAIKPYLEMLIAKKQDQYLAHLFNVDAFKNYFLPHYEAYISLLINPKYPCTKMNEMIVIINRINNNMTKYL